jgi:hypothetical protein
VTTIKFVDRLTDDLIEDAWRVYHGCFAPLEILAAQSHLMHRLDFDALMLDNRITKALFLDDNGELIGLGTYSNDLTVVPLISWKYYRHRWPDAYDADAIFYILFVAVAGDAPFRTYYSFVEHIYELAAPLKGIVAVDACNYNVRKRNLLRAIAAATARLSGGRYRHGVADSQNYAVYDVTGAYTSEELTA